MNFFVIDSAKSTTLKAVSNSLTNASNSEEIEQASIPIFQKSSGLDSQCNLIINSILFDKSNAYFQ